MGIWGMMSVTCCMGSFVNFWPVFSGLHLPNKSRWMSSTLIQAVSPCANMVLCSLSTYHKFFPSHCVLWFWKWGGKYLPKFCLSKQQTFKTIFFESGINTLKLGPWAKDLSQGCNESIGWDDNPIKAQLGKNSFLNSFPWMLAVPHWILG